MPTKRSQECMDLKLGKASKPLIEKRRRARINQSLAQLKTLVIDPKTTESSRQAKLEKADILEMTVKHLREMKKGQNTDMDINAEHHQQKFERGFSECVHQVEHFLASVMDPQISGNEENLRKRLKEHLWQILHGLQKRDFESTIPQEETLNGQSPSPSKKIAQDFSFVNQNFQNLAKPIECGGESLASNSIDLTLNHSPHKQNATVFNPNVSNSIANFQPSEEKSNHYNVHSLRVATSYDISQSSCSPFTDSSVEMNASESSPFNLSLDKPDDGRSPCTFYANPVPKSQDSIHNNDKSNASFYHQQTASSTMTNNRTESFRETFEQKQMPSYLDSDCAQSNFVHQIPLLPRRLQNGEWALVLPGSLSLTENGVHNPFSAFRFVLPSCPSEVDPEQLRRRSQIDSSSPLSSSVSDMSSEEYCYRSDGEGPVKLEYNGHNDTFGYVWRPW